MQATGRFEYIAVQWHEGNLWACRKQAKDLKTINPDTDQQVSKAAKLDGAHNVADLRRVLWRGGYEQPIMFEHRGRWLWHR